jgi:hypothetical protein
MPITNITPLPVPPSRSDPINFSDRADTFLAALPTFTNQLNLAGDDIEAAQLAIQSLADEADASKIDAQLSADLAMDLSHFRGKWVGLTGTATVPFSVSHSLKIWFLVNNLANIALSEPGVSADWIEFENQYVNTTTNQTVSGVKTFSNSPVVPSGATGSQVAQASESLLKAGNLSGLANTATSRTNLGLGSAATRTALGSTGSLYSRDSILGTTSQSAGIPTGAIIERGSNGNGEYVRFADGTQICTLLSTPTIAATTGPLNGLYYGTATWTFPAVFVGNVVASVGGVAAGTLSLCNPQPANTTTVSYYILSPTSISSRVYTLSFIAIGRWF